MINKALDKMNKLDLTGLACPMPIIKLKKFLAQNPDYQFIELVFTDKGGLKDIPAFCQQQNIGCEVVKETPPYEIHLIQPN